ncbi:hypothetical protein BB560_001242 [Smittium megazygosporum]|uniref:Repressor of RNA polymerase III transcription MAF1 n=1 Tax=Smittium megazygosporum TaxID=133381 RepID=A0A2T9ZI67_9FUNG|nr:hypothetical protein BB560_001242 [Smittium megazygosporum]
MKFLQIPDIDNLNELLSFKTASGHFVSGRIEVYSCKIAGDDKKLYKYLKKRYTQEEEELNAASGYSPESALQKVDSSEASSRRILFYLISTLNSSFPDYDFKSLEACEFTQFFNISDVINTVNITLFNVGCPNLLQHRELWREIDSSINLDDCLLFAYNPVPESDPYGDDFPIESNTRSGLTSYASFASLTNEFGNADEISIS